MFHFPLSLARLCMSILSVCMHASELSLNFFSSGMWGCVPMIFLRSTVALMWTAISVVQAGGFLENMISAIWPRFQHWNHLPASANITSAGILSVVLYWCIQTYVSMLPIRYVSDC